MPDGNEGGPTPALWRVLDLLLMASAVALDSEPQIAGFAMLVAIPVGSRLGLAPTALRLMRESAAAEVRTKFETSECPLRSFKECALVEWSEAK
jgi:hypothetical protein